MSMRMSMSMNYLYSYIVRETSRPLAWVYWERACESSYSEISSDSLNFFLRSPRGTLSTLYVQLRAPFVSLSDVRKGLAPYLICVSRRNIRMCVHGLRNGYQYRLPFMCLVHIIISTQRLFGMANG